MFDLKPLNRPRVSVVTPVLNEDESLRGLHRGLDRLLGDSLFEFIVVYSPRSSAETRETCRELAELDPRVRLIEQRDNPGVGRAFREGYAIATGDPILSVDSDGEMEAEAVPKMLAKMIEGNHGLVVGSRWAPGGGFVGYSRLKKPLNLMFQKLFGLLFQTKIHDLTYGFKLTRGEVVRSIEWEATLHEIGCETTLKPIRVGVSVAEVPTIWTARVSGRSSNRFSSNFRYVKTALAILFKGVRITREFDRSDQSLAEFASEPRSRSVPGRPSRESNAAKSNRFAEIAKDADS